MPSSRSRYIGGVYYTFFFRLAGSAWTLAMFDGVQWSEPKQFANLNDVHDYVDSEFIRLDREDNYEHYMVDMEELAEAERAACAEHI